MCHSVLNAGFYGKLVCHDDTILLTISQRRSTPTIQLEGICAHIHSITLLLCAVTFSVHHTTEAQF